MRLMHRTYISSFTVWLLLILGTAPMIVGQEVLVGQVAPAVFTGRRIALVIGNDAYPQAPLRNAVNDSRTISQAMESRGFSVQLLTDVALDQLEIQTTTFVSTIRANDMVLVFYSGHGMQVDGDNYMIPIDFAASTELDAKRRAYSIGKLIDAINDRKPSLSMLILDACRNNPFSGARSPLKGWAVMQGAFGNFIAYGTSPGSTASDNPEGKNGLFTEQIAEVLSQEPDLKLDDLFNKVRARVYSKSQARQLPWSSSSVIGEFRFGAARNAVMPMSDVPMSTGSAADLWTVGRVISPAQLPNTTGNRAATLPQERAPLPSPARLSDVVAMLHTAQYPEVIRTLTASVNSPASRTNALRLRAIAYALGGLHPAARADIAEASAVKGGDDEYLTHHIGCLVNILGGTTNAAIDEATAAIKAQPNTGEAYLCLANAYFTAGKNEQALRAYRQAMALQPLCKQCSQFKLAIDSRLGQRDVSQPQRVDILIPLEHHIKITSPSQVLTMSEPSAPGWDIEVYRNGQMIDTAQLIGGENDFTVVGCCEIRPTGGIAVGDTYRIRFMVWRQVLTY